MRRFGSRRRERISRRMFETRSEAWREVGLGAEIDSRARARARGEAVAFALLIAAVLVVFGERRELFPGFGREVRWATVVLLIALGWGLARALGRGVAPALFRRMDPGTAGTVGFLIRLIAILVMTIVALRIAGVKAGALAVGGAFTAVVLGLAAQQTVGNLFAGLVLQSTRPFRVGERVRLIGGFIGGQVEGVVASLGLFYTTLISGSDRMMVPNGVLINLAIVPLREPARVEVRARLGPETTPSQLQGLLEESISVPTRYPPHITLEELDRDEVVVQIVATPDRPADGARLADEIIAAARRADAVPASGEGGDGG